MGIRSAVLLSFGVLSALALGYLLAFTNNESGSMRTSEESHDGEVVETYEIYPGEAAEKIRNGEDIVLLDVRTPEEYEELHLRNALLLPVQELSARTLAEIGLGEDAKGKEIIIYCRSGARSKTAYDIMDSLGYTDIKSVAGGMIHWQEDGYPFTETGAYAGPRAVGGGEKDSASSGGPRIAFDRLSHDFGVIPQYGGSVETTFAVRNEGDAELVIGDITTSCSCTSAQLSASNIPPGEEAALTVVFDPDFHEEPAEVFKRTVFIPTNDPADPEAEVTIVVDIAEST